MGRLYYLMRSSSELNGLGEVVDRKIELDDDVFATISIGKFESVGLERQAFGTIVLHFILRDTRKEMKLILREKSGLLLLDAGGRVTHRKYAQEALRRTLKMDLGFLPVYQRNLVTLLKNVDCRSITIAMPGDYEELDPKEEPFDWNLVEEQPFVEARFRISDSEGRIHNIRLTSQTILVEDDNDITLDSAAKVVERYLLQGLNPGNAWQTC